MNKETMLHGKEKELLALMIKDRNNKSIIFGKISIEMLSDRHKSIFSMIHNDPDIDEFGITFILRQQGYTNIQEILDLSYRSSDVSRRVKEYFDIYDSIKCEGFLKKALEKSKETLLGYDLLCSLTKSFEEEKIKYSRFERIQAMSEYFGSIIERLENQATGSNGSIKTKYYSRLNSITGGFNPGNLIGIAGAFKSGKTTFGLNLLMDYAEQNIPVAAVSLEMCASEFENKIITLKANIPTNELRNPESLSDSKIKAIAQLKIIMKDEHVYIFDRLVSFEDIETKIRELAHYYGVKVILIDYLNLIRSARRNNNETREREIAFYSSSLKALAKETETIIVLLTQLNRNGITEASSSNLAESIALARDCDFLFTISQPYLTMKQLRYLGELIDLDPSYFITKLDISRHTQSGDSTLLNMLASGKMQEVNVKTQ